VQDRLQAPESAPQGSDGEATASPGSGQEDAREAPQAAPSDADGTPGRDEIPPRLPDEPPRAETLDPGRPKRSGWWQRAKVSWRG
jgi:ribonuclease E